MYLVGVCATIQYSVILYSVIEFDKHIPIVHTRLSVL